MCMLEAGKNLRLTMLTVIVSMSFWGLTANAQDDGQEFGYIVRLLGADTPEVLDEHDVEQFSAFLSNPLQINFATLSKLASSGLFTQYQVASLLDYRNKNGDILSLSELALVDGFSQERVEALAPFISLYSNALAGQSSVRGRVTSNDIALRTAFKTNEGVMDYNYGVKYRLSVNDSFQMGLSTNKPYGLLNAVPSGGSFYFAYYGKRNLGKIVVGDYRLKYGQGLMLWNGFTMSSLSSVESFSRRPSGITPYWSYSGEDSVRGVAADVNVGRFTISASLGMDGLWQYMEKGNDRGVSLMPSMNVTWYGKNAQIGVTGYVGTNEVTAHADSLVNAGGISGDFRWCVKGTDIFGEVTMDALTMQVKAIAGAIFKVTEDIRLAVRGGYAQDEYSLAGACEFRAGDWVQLNGRSGFGSSVRRHSITLTTENSYFPYKKYGRDEHNYQVRLLLNYKVQASPSVGMGFRVAQRLRSAKEVSRSELRYDLQFSSGDWAANCRLDGTYNKSFGLLSYVEGGWRPEFISIWLRSGLFRIDNWEDRIYVYERDSPGNFNVPAYYGRGYWIAATVGAKVASWCKIYLRASTLQYPWTSPTASLRYPKSEVKLMFAVNLTRYSGM